MPFSRRQFLLAAAATVAPALVRAEAALPLGALGASVFVPGRGAAEIAAIDLAQDSVAATWALPFGPDTVVAMTAIGRLVVGNRIGRTLSVIDPASGTIEATFRLPLSPEVLLASPDGLRVAVADPGAGALALVSFIGPSIDALIEGVSTPGRLTFDADGIVLLHTDSAARLLRAISTRSGRELGTVALPEGAAAPDLSALTRTTQSRFGMVSDAANARLHRIDFDAGAVGDSLSVGPGPVRAYATADGRVTILPCAGDSSVHLIDTAGFTPLAVVAGVAAPTSVATGDFERLAYVFGAGAPEAAILDLERMERVGTLALPGLPGVAMADADGRRIYVPIPERDGVAVIDVAGQRVARLVRGLPRQPAAVVMAQTNNFCH